jgi:hypothetical protein
MILFRGALIIALALVTLEVLTGASRTPLPPVVRSSPPAVAVEIVEPTPLPTESVSPSEPVTPSVSVAPNEPAASPSSAASCFEMRPPLLVACPGESVRGGGWELVLADGWAAIAPDEEFLPSLFGPGTEAGPFLNELGARGSARGIAAVVLGRSGRPLEMLGLSSAESVRGLLAARYPDRTVAVLSFSRPSKGRIFAAGSLTRDGLASRFVLFAVADSPSISRIAFAWAPWSSVDELYAIIGAR